MADRGAASTSSRKRKAVPAPVLAACALCRRMKVRCNGMRPACSRCKLSRVRCVYETNADETRSQALRRRHDELHLSHIATVDSLLWLATQPPEVMSACLQQIDQVDNPAHQLCANVAAHQAQQLPPTLSPANTIVANSPWLTDLGDVHLLLQNSKIYPWLSVEDCIAPHVTLDKNHDTRATRALRSAKILNQSDTTPVSISFWIAVPIPDEIAVSLIDLYLRVEHPLTSFFDAELFLRDFHTRDTHFCCSLLITSILAWTCSTFAPIVPQAGTYQEALTASALQLLAAEKTVPSLTTVASLMILSLSSICAGADTQAKMHMTNGIRMAETLHLVGHDRHDIKHFAHLTQEEQSMLLYVAWSTFNLSTIYALHFRDLYCGTFTPSPPLLPCPQPKPLTPQMDAKPSTILPVTSAAFPYFCEFWCIAHEIFAVYYARCEPIQHHVPLAFAWSRYRRLLQWAARLPDELARSGNMTHDIVQMHLCYHVLMMEVFRPFVTHRMGVSNLAAHQLQSVFVLSFDHLRALIRYYHSAFSSTEYSHTITWIHGPLYVASSIVACENQTNPKANFMHTMETFSNLAASHRVVATFVKGLYGMAIKAGLLTVSEAKQHWSSLYMREVGRHSHSTILPVTTIVVDHTLALEDLASAQGSKLAQAFDEMMLFEDFVSIEQ